MQGCVTSWALAHHILVKNDSSSWTRRRGSWIIAGDLKTSEIIRAVSNTCAFHEKILPDVICWCANISDGYYGVLLHCNLNFCRAWYLYRHLYFVSLVPSWNCHALLFMKFCVQFVYGECVLHSCVVHSGAIVMSCI